MEEAKHEVVEEPVEDKPAVKEEEKVEIVEKEEKDAEPEQKQEVIAPPQSIEKNEVDGEFIKQIWPYLRLGAAMPDEKELNDK